MPKLTVFEWQNEDTDSFKTDSSYDEEVDGKEHVEVGAKKVIFQV